MDFHPDIIVTDDGLPRVRLVVEVRAVPIDGETAWTEHDRELAAYMTRQGAHTALVVQPGRARVYREKFAADATTPPGTGRVAPIAVDVVADIDTSAVRQLQPRTGEQWQYASAVQAWLEHLPIRSNRASLTGPLREAVERELMPELWGGDIRAAGPRGPEWYHLRAG